MNAGMHFKPRGMNRAVLLLAAAFPAGCGSDVSTNPIAGNSLSSQSEVGELTLGDSGRGIAAPRNLDAQFIAPGSMSVTWTPTQEAYATIILRDGAEVGRVSAQSGSFEDVLPDRVLGVDTHLYTVCFGRGIELGPEAFIEGVLPRPELLGTTRGVIEDN